MPQFKAPKITNLDAVPTRLASKIESAGVVKVTADSIELPVAVADDVVHLLRIPVRGLLPRLFMGWDDLDTGVNAVFDIGIHRTSEDGGDALDPDLFATAQSAQAAKAMTDFRYSLLGVESVAQRIWELLGLSEAPDYQLVDITLTLTAGPTTTVATVAGIAEYTDGQ